MCIGIPFSYLLSLSAMWHPLKNKTDIVLLMNRITFWASLYLLISHVERPKWCMQCWCLAPIIALSMTSVCNWENVSEAWPDMVLLPWCRSWSLIGKQETPSCNKIVNIYVCNVVNDCSDRSIKFMSYCMSSGFSSLKHSYWETVSPESFIEFHFPISCICFSLLMQLLFKINQLKLFQLQRRAHLSNSFIILVTMLLMYIVLLDLEVVKFH